MRHLILTVVVGLSAASGNLFSQTGKIGILGEASSNGEYVKVKMVNPGTPAQFAGLKVSDRIYRMDGSAVGPGKNWVDMIEGPPGTEVVLTISRFGKPKMFDVKVPRISVTRSSIPEGELMAKIITNDFTSFNVGGIHNAALSVLHDKTRDLFKYHTYDYEYTSATDPLLEKELMNQVGGKLDRMGMHRDMVNPDLLIVMTFYSGKKEQYVPPQQIVSTKIKQSYNFYWGYIPVPVTETQTTPGYTQVTYLASIGLKFLDNHEISINNVPPVVWSGTFTETAIKNVYLNEIVDIYLSFLLHQFPETYFPNSERYYLDDYASTGIWYDLNDLAVIAEVNPGSPAFRAGLLRGDKIISINGYALPVSYDAVGPQKWSNLICSGNKTGLRYLYMYADIKFKSYKEGTNTLRFKIKRNGKIMTVDIQPEKEQFYKMLK